MRSWRAHRCRHLRPAQSMMPVLVSGRKILRRGSMQSTGYNPSPRILLAPSFTLVIAYFPNFVRFNFLESNISIFVVKVKKRQSGNYWFSVMKILRSSTKLICSISDFKIYKFDFSKCYCIMFVFCVQSSRVCWSNAAFDENWASENYGSRRYRLQDGRWLGTLRCNKPTPHRTTLI